MSESEKVTYIITVDRGMFPFTPGSEVVVRMTHLHKWTKDVFFAMVDKELNMYICKNMPLGCCECHSLATHAHLLGTLPTPQARQLAQSLGYAREDSILKIYERHKEEFSSMMSATVKMTVGITEVMVRIFSLRGCHLIAMFARTPVAKAFRRWVLDVLDKLAEEERAKLAAAAKPKRERKALGKSLPLVERLQLTPWEKLSMDKQAMTILERAGNIGPRTMECILLKLRYLDAIHDMFKMTNQLAADIDRVRTGVFGKIVQAGNVTGGFVDPIMDILCDDTYHLRKLGDELHTTAFRGLNASICGAKMLRV